MHFQLIVLIDPDATDREEKLDEAETRADYVLNDFWTEAQVATEDVVCYCIPSEALPDGAGIYTGDELDNLTAYQEELVNRAADPACQECHEGVAQRWYNPHARYDGAVIGGRFTGFMYGYPQDKDKTAEVHDVALLSEVYQQLIATPPASFVDPNLEWYDLSDGATKQQECASYLEDIVQTWPNAVCVLVDCHA